jgi:hypothetical protein
MSKASRFNRTAMTALLVGLAVSTWPEAPVQAATGPVLWGYGVKSCRDFLAAAPAEGAPTTLGSDEYPRYREWLAGLITGLNLATASDTLHGAELEAALGRIQAHCRSRPQDDFFNAAMALIRSFTQPKRTGKGASPRPQ